jgi:hypothetical protein
MTIESEGAHGTLWSPTSEKVGNAVAINPVAFKSARRQECLKKLQGPAFGWRDGGAADQPR